MTVSLGAALYDALELMAKEYSKKAKRELSDISLREFLESLKTLDTNQTVNEVNGFDDLKSTWENDKSSPQIINPEDVPI